MDAFGGSSVSLALAICMISVLGPDENVCGRHRCHIDFFLHVNMNFDEYGISLSTPRELTECCKFA